MSPNQAPSSARTAFDWKSSATPGWVSPQASAGRAARDGDAERRDSLDALARQREVGDEREDGCQHARRAST